MRYVAKCLRELAFVAFRCGKYEDVPKHLEAAAELDRRAKKVIIENRYSDDQPRDDRGRWTDGGGSGASGNMSGGNGLYRKSGNTGEFAHLPERMTKKHIRNVADEYGIDLSGISLHIDDNPELLKIEYAGRADPENIGGITFFPNAFRSREELVRTIYHEKQHILQYKKYGSEYVQNNRAYFERITENMEENYIGGLKRSGKL